MTDRASRWRDVAPLLVLAALAVGFLWPATLGGKAMLPGDLLLIMEPWRQHASKFPEFQRVSNPILDAVQQFYPWRKYAGESLRNGVIPLWNPYELCGTPFVGNNQSAVFYPETWLHALMPTERALGWATAVYFFLAGGLAYWFLRTIDLRRPAALLGAIAFMFNGFIVGWLCFPSFRSVPGWLPGMLAGFELCLRRKRVGWAAVSALCVGMQFLAGNLHISLLVLVVFGAYVAFRCIGTWLQGDRVLALTAAACAAVSGLVGAMLAAIQLVPSLELAGMSSRAGGIPYAEVLKHALALPYVLVALMPDIFGNPVDYNHWGANLGQTYRAYTETAWYVGVVPLLLAPAAFLARRRAMSWFWLAMLVVGLALAFGTPLNALLYYLVPGARGLTGIGRAVLISSASLAVLAALGLDELLNRLGGEGRQAVPMYAAIAGLAVGLVGLVAGLWVWMRTGSFESALPGIGGYTGMQVARFGLFCLLGSAAAALLVWRPKAAVAALIALLVVDLYWFVDKFTPMVRPEYLHVQAGAIDRILQDREPVRVLSLGRDAIRRMPPNTGMIFGLEDIQGSDSLEIGAYRRLLNALYSDDLGFPQPDPALPAVDLLGAKYIITGLELEGVSGIEPVHGYGGRLYLNLEALPRAFTVPSYGVKVDQASVLAEVTSARFRPAQEAWFVGSDVPTAAAGPRATAKRMRVTAHDANEVTIEGEFTPGQLVVLADAYYPGWRAFQDGRECHIMRANYALRAVQIEDRCRQIRFVYAPTSYGVGAFASLVALALLTGVGVSRLAAPRRGAG